MPIIKVWGISKVSAFALKDLRTLICTAVAAVKPLDLTPDKVSVIFPLEQAEAEPAELIVEISGLFHSLRRTQEARKTLAHAVGHVLQSFAQDRMLQFRFAEVLVEVFHPDEGYCGIEGKK